MNPTAEQMTECVFGRVAPTVPVRDLEKSLRFLGDGLGFESVFTNGDPPTFAVMKRDEAELHVAVRPRDAGHGHCHVLVSDVHAVHAALMRSHPASVRQTPKDQEWGMRDILVEDPDGNVMEIAQRLTPEHDAG